MIPNITYSIKINNARMSNKMFPHVDIPIIASAFHPKKTGHRVTTSPSSTKRASKILRSSWVRQQETHLDCNPIPKVSLFIKQNIVQQTNTGNIVSTALTVIITFLLLHPILSRGVYRFHSTNPVNPETLQGRPLLVDNSGICAMLKLHGIDGINGRPSHNGNLYNGYIIILWIIMAY